MVLDRLKKLFRNPILFTGGLILWGLLGLYFIKSPELSARIYAYHYQSYFEGSILLKDAGKKKTLQDHIILLKVPLAADRELARSFIRHLAERQNCKGFVPEAFMPEPPQGFSTQKTPTSGPYPGLKVTQEELITGAAWKLFQEAYPEKQPPKELIVEHQLSMFKNPYGAEDTFWSDRSLQPLDFQQALLDYQQDPSFWDNKTLFVADEWSQGFMQQVAFFGNLDPNQWEATLYHSLETPWSLNFAPFWLQALLLTLFTVSFSIAFLLRNRILFLLSPAFIIFGLIIVTQVFFNEQYYVDHGSFWVCSLIIIITLSLYRLLTVQTLSRAFLGDKALLIESLTKSERQIKAIIIFVNIPQSVLEQEDNLEQYRKERLQISRQLTRIIHQHKGWVMDYQGDKQMLALNLEENLEKPEHSAFVAGLDLWHYFHKTYPEDTVSVGITQGLVSLGWLGSERSKHLATIGDTTNKAARIQNYGQKNGYALILGPSVWQALSQSETIESQGHIIPKLTVKGKRESIDVKAWRKEDLSES